MIVELNCIGLLLLQAFISCSSGVQVEDIASRQILAASGESILIQEEIGIGHKDGLALALKTTVCTDNFDIFSL
ncbi:hypothetical protein EB796_008023 [Bugula neritina]|uniref:Uncharacterized protein n=1 Tax=Bugula neritina TaxID=10212 RepID=A0A7J7K4V0_BUGNE|nr:hypothetical protein EB796_008023 [Bugula neritina]